MLKQQALTILQTLEENGFVAYFVGGCVRDWLLDRPVHDIDICTNAHPRHVMQLFPEHVPTGLQHGTVSVKAGTSLFEVTTFRTDGIYEDFRRPKEVIFVDDLKKDLERRDFTINAMAMDRHDQLIDPFNGRQDLNDRLIRAVGNPHIRFREDALRLLRGARFASQLGFSIEPKTLAAMRETAPLLARIAVERIKEELTKLLDSYYPQEGCRIIVETNLFSGFDDDRLQRLFAQGFGEAWRLVHLHGGIQKWCLLFYAAGLSPKDAQELCTRLRLSKREAEAIAHLLHILSEMNPIWDQPQTIEWRKWLLQAGLDVCLAVERLLCVCWWNNPDPESLSSLYEAYEQLPVKTVKELAITGLDLREELKKPAGGWISHTLLFLLEQTALRGLANTRESLLAAAKKEVERYEHQTGNS